MPAQRRGRLQKRSATAPRVSPHTSTSSRYRQDEMIEPEPSRRTSKSMSLSNSTTVLHTEDSQGHQSNNAAAGSSRGAIFAENSVYTTTNGIAEVTFGPLSDAERGFKYLMNSFRSLTRRSFIKVSFSNLAEYVSKPRHHTKESNKSLLKTANSNRCHRSVTFDPSVEGMGVSAPAAHDRYLDVYQLAEKDLRLKFFDKMFMQLEKIFLKSDYLLSLVNQNMSPERREISTKRAFKYWKKLLVGENRLYGTPQEQARQMGMHMMHCAATIIFRRAFKEEFLNLHWNRGFDADILWDAAEDMTEVLLEFFAPFERDPFGDCHEAFAEDLTDLSITALELRTLLNPTREYKFLMNMPLHEHDSERRFKFISGKARLYETLPHTPSSEGLRKVYVTLCGGITRKSESIRKASGRIPRHYSVCERKAVVVGYFPDADDRVGDKGYGYGKNGEEFSQEARQRGWIRQEKVAREWAEIEIEC